MPYSNNTYIAGNRFGLGLKPGEAAIVEADPKGWLLTQLDTIARRPAFLADLPPTAEFMAELSDQRSDMQRIRQGNNVSEQAQRARRESRRVMVQDQQTHTLLRLQSAINTDTPFAERLLHFWSNHFTVAVSAGPKAIIRQIALPYEQEAIRSNLDKDFASLLLAVEQHPAMLVYLDNAVSIGPGSVVGKRRDRGLNENLAREILELHTLGVNGGYTQDDVTSLAKIITGWTVADQRFDRLPNSRPDKTTGFTYIPQLHEPGSHRLLGKSYRNADMAQGLAALEDLARHPATARHIAEKLVRHFVSDAAPDSAITKLETVFLETGGDLPSLHTALVNLDEAWQPGQQKLKTPQDLVVSTARALELGESINNQPRVANLFTRILSTFGQMPYTALSPAGWEDSATYWGGPDALMKRMEWANSIAALNSKTIDALALADQVLSVDQHLQQELSRAESGHQALTLLLASPANQWR